jgi:hypothetical protein
MSEAIAGVTRSSTADSERPKSRLPKNDTTVERKNDTTVERTNMGPEAERRGAWGARH